MAIATVADYDFCEEKATVDLPNRVIEVFQPVAFGIVGYPIRVKQDKAVSRYIDAMHECRVPEMVDVMLQGLTPTEMDLLQRLLVKYREFGLSAFGKVVLPRGTALQSMHIVRQLRFLFGDERPRVFEFGAGSGATGALLIAEGYPYAATDVTQGFYLIQSRLWDFFSGGRLLEGTIEPSARDLLARVGYGVPGHLPWWDLVSLDTKNLPSYDVVMANHAVCEMHDHSLRFSLQVARGLLRGSSNPNRCFMFQGWGWSDEQKRAVATKRFYEAGFRLVHHDPQVVIFAPEGSPGEYGGLSYQPPEAVGFPPPSVFQPENGPLTQTVLAGRTSIAPFKTVGIDGVERLYAGILGSNDPSTPDEKFWVSVGHAMPSVAAAKCT